MVVTVRRETPRQPAVAALLRQSDALAVRLYPGEPRGRLTPETLDAPDVSVLVARDGEGTALGCCALLEPGGSTAELKRMIVDEAHRRHGVGAALVRAAEALAAERGIRVLRLEVGVRNAVHTAGTHSAPTFITIYRSPRRGRSFGRSPPRDRDDASTRRASITTLCHRGCKNARDVGRFEE